MADSNKIDVAIIGSGGAGCAAALEAQKITDNVVLITKTNVLSSNTALAQGGIQAAVGGLDSPAVHFADTIEAGGSKCDPLLVEKMVYNAPKTIKWLRAIGVKFDQKSGKYILKKGAGMTHPRLLSAGDKTGLAIMEALKKQIINSKIPVMEFFELVSLNSTGDYIELSVQGMDRAVDIKCKAVVFCTGGSSHSKALRSGELSTNHKNATSETSDIAKKAGLELVDPGLFQYHPTVVMEPDSLKGIPAPETIRASGARLINKNGESFVYELTKRTDLSKSIIEECEKGLGFTSKNGKPCVKLTTEEVDGKNYPGFLAANFPGIYQRFKRFGTDIAKEPILVYPALHYQLGGIKIDKDGRTSIPGIFAAGEITGGIHGVERLIGNSLLDILVFGKAAGKAAAKYATGE